MSIQLPNTTDFTTRISYYNSIWSVITFKILINLDCRFSVNSCFIRIPAGFLFSDLSGNSCFSFAFICCGNETVKTPLIISAMKYRNGDFIDMTGTLFLIINKYRPWCCFTTSNSIKISLGNSLLKYQYFIL